MLFAGAAPLHILTKALTGRSPWPRRFLAAVGWIGGLRVRSAGAPIRPHSLLLVNHVSWLDILAIGGATGAAFVSKDNLGSGFVHWLADQQHTIYVSRENRRQSQAQAEAIARALDRGSVALFPEGTTGPGTHLLPFRSTLIEAARHATRDIAIRPVALDYGEEAAAISWHEEPALANFCRIMGRAGTIAVTVRLLEPLPPGLHRKQVAVRARSAIAAALGFAGEEPSPIGGSI